MESLFGITAVATSQSLVDIHKDASFDKQVEVDEEVNGANKTKLEEHDNIHQNLEQTSQEFVIKQKPRKILLLKFIS